MRAEIMSDGEIRGASLVMPFGNLPSAAIANDQTVVANIDSRKNKRRIWLFVANKVEITSKL